MSDNLTVLRSLATLPISTYVTEGLAKLSGFEILRHGTAFPNYINILKKGTDPGKGGSTCNFGKECRTDDSLYRRFHVFKDSDNKLAHRVPFIGHIFKRTNPRLHTTISGGSYAYAHSRFKWRCVRIALGIASGVAHLLFCPVLRFAYKKEELPNYFENDPDYGNLAFRTHRNKSLSAHRIGLIGLCKQVTKKDFKQTWEKDKLRVLIGTIQLLAGLILTVTGAGLFL